MTAVRANDLERIESIFVAPAAINCTTTIESSNRTVRTVAAGTGILPSSSRSCTKTSREKDNIPISPTGSVIPTSPLQALSPEQVYLSYEATELQRGGRGTSQRKSESASETPSSSIPVRPKVSRQLSTGCAIPSDANKSKKISPPQSLLAGSCPNLREQLTSPALQTKSGILRHRAASDVRIKIPTMAECGPDVSTRSLNVPDVFTTSFTHNKTQSSPKTAPRSERPRSSSSRNSVESATSSVIIPYPGETDDSNSSVEGISRPLSSTKASVASMAGSEYDLRMADIIPVIQRSTSSELLYRDAYLSQILDYLYIGSIEAAYNVHVLCKLEVQSFVDLTNITSAEEHIYKGKTIPCLCPLQGNHPRSRLRLAIKDAEHEDFQAFFGDINSFIEGNRKREKTILIFSYQGRSRAATAVIQYLMQYHDMPLRTAYGLVKSRRPQLRINPGFQKILERLDSQLHPNKPNSYIFRSENVYFEEKTGRVTAWTAIDKTKS